MVERRVDQDQLGINPGVNKNTNDDASSGQPKRRTVKRSQPNAPNDVHIATEDILHTVDDIADDLERFYYPRQNSRIIERDEFSGKVVVTIGSRYFNTSDEIIWVGFFRSKPTLS